MCIFSLELNFISLLLVCFWWLFYFIFFPFSLEAWKPDICAQSVHIYSLLETDIWTYYILRILLSPPKPLTWLSHVENHL